MPIEYQGATVDGGSNQLNNVSDVEVVNVDGNVFALAGGQDGVLSVYSVDNDPASATYGEMSSTPVSTVTDDGTTELSDIWAIESIEVGGTTYIVAGGDDDGLSVFSIDSSGNLANTDNFADDGTTNIKDLDALATATVDDGGGGTNSFVFAGGSEGGLSVFQIDGSGNLTNVDNVADGGALNLGTIYGMDTVQIDDGGGGQDTFLIAGDWNDGLSVFEVASDGTLTNTQNVADSGSEFLKDVVAVDTHVIDGTGYVFVGGYEGGVSVYEIDNVGTLTNRGNLADDGALNLDNIEMMHVADVEGTPTLWVTGDDAGTDTYSITVNGDGSVTLTRTNEFAFSDGKDKGLAIDGDSGFVVQALDHTHSIESFTAPCFATGTLIATPSGERAVEELRVGDLVMTCDRGARPVRWIGRRDLTFDGTNTNQKPIEIKAGSLGGGLPRRDLVVSPQHRMVLEDGREQVLGLAKGLTGFPGVRWMAGRRRVSYHAILLDRYEIIYAEGAPTESFRPGPYILSTFPDRLRAAVFAAMPGLADDPETALGPPARPILKLREVRELVRRQRPDAGEFDRWDADLKDERETAAARSRGRAA